MLPGITPSVGLTGKKRGMTFSYVTSYHKEDTFVENVIAAGGQAGDLAFLQHIGYGLFWTPEAHYPSSWSGLGTSSYGYAVNDFSVKVLDGSETAVDVGPNDVYNDIIVSIFRPSKPITGWTFTGTGVNFAYGGTERTMTTSGSTDASIAVCMGGRSGLNTTVNVTGNMSYLTFIIGSTNKHFSSWRMFGSNDAKVDSYVNPNMTSTTIAYAYTWVELQHS
jgi:hypothetical protein